MRLSQRQIILLISAALVVTTLIAYEPIRHNDFVNYDDHPYITSNPNVNRGITSNSVLWAFTKPHCFMWHPLTTISHIVDCQFFGLKPLGHHFVSVAIHIVSALLLFWILKNITGTMWLSAFVAAVFALHPLQVESVAWAAERKTVLSGLFWLLTMAAYIHYAKQPRLGRYLVVLLVFGLCIMTKPVVVTLPFALLLLDYWPLERIGGRRTEDPASLRFAVASRRKMAEKERQKASLKWSIIEKIPLLAMSAILAVITYLAQQSGGAVQALEKISLDYRVANMFLSYISYIGKMLWPSRLAAFYPHPHVNLSNPIVVICAAAFLLISIFSIYLHRRRKYVTVGWLWYVGTLVPTIGLVQSSDQAMANRYMYIPMLGLLIIIGWTVKDFIIHRPRVRIAATVISVIALLSLLILTRIQVRHWQNTLTLFEYALNVTRDNDIAENSYGRALLDKDMVDEAEKHLRNAVRITPAFVEARDNLALALSRQNKIGDAIIQFTEVLKLAPNTDIGPKPDIRYEAYANLGIAYNQSGRYEAAIHNWTKALELKPDSITTLNNLSWLLATVEDKSLEDPNKAIEYAERACSLTGNNKAEILDTLAAAYASGGKFEEAVITAQKAIEAAKSRDQDNLAGNIQKRMELYKAGQRYIQK